LPSAPFQDTGFAGETLTQLWQVQKIAGKLDCHLLSDIGAFLAVTATPQSFSNGVGLGDRFGA
jgi:hypothetical protein